MHCWHGQKREYGFACCRLPQHSHAMHGTASPTALRIGAPHPAGCFLFRYPIV